MELFEIGGGVGQGGQVMPTSKGEGVHIEGEGGAIDEAPLSFGHGGECGLHELEPLDLPQRAAHPR
jgi:hypothetical protein